MATAQETKNNITLRGSTEIVSEFFSYAVNSILYQRGIYPPETFERKKKYGLQMLVTADHGLNTYLSQVLMQLSGWLMQGALQKLVLVITSAATQEPLERWTFDIQPDCQAQTQEEVVQKPQKEIMSEIQAIIRQITASVTFLPMLEEACTFDLLVYTNLESSVPQEWEESDPRYITDQAEVRLRSFTTKVHKVDTMVAYKQEM
mmetsp:Transcript_25636/g.35427  ORF Transcript_25636/g.35427 Transcript_25636/m.35427 type:complete len:204 (+) Transcript_25636:404-1015(+)|eukprot:CAMPEP_0196575964 /NCGR_PEP_ID=MMETSP1081-20130531/5345_1 /TAXON_ID=36882 /ORGANISM="Pyramimonas amylifera, Strain CCMP720" /LENGTH=203 /DNA_ID=CAMNT_0041894435 /DNA_START=402 /DNA_END=1013 /DNA_ORIENTATION=+